MADIFSQYAVQPEADVFAQYAQPKTATPAPDAAMQGMLAQSTAKGDPKQPRRLIDLVPKTTPEQDKQYVDAAIPFMIPTQQVVAGAKAAPGAMARLVGLSKVRGGANIQAATEAANDVALNVEKAGREGLRAIELQQAGASMPRAASQFMQRITHPAKTDLTFGEARDFYSNLSRLSAKETTSLNSVMRRQVLAMRDALHSALVEGADTVGKGKQYASGMKEYARASQAAKYGAKAAKWGAGALGAGATYKMVTDALK